MSDKELDKMLESRRSLPPIVYPVRELYGTILDAENRQVCRAPPSACEEIVKALNECHEVRNYVWLIRNLDWLGFQIRVKEGPAPSNTLDRSFSKGQIAQGDLDRAIQRIRDRKG